MPQTTTDARTVTSKDSEGSTTLAQSPPAATAVSATLPRKGPLIASLIGLVGDDKTPMITYAGGKGSLAARSLVPLDGCDVGKDVLLLFSEDSPDMPIIVGSLEIPKGSIRTAAATPPVITADGQRVIVKAEKQLVLQCGRASITLTQSGKVIIDGAYVSSRSEGVNRIKGASVDIN